MAYSILRPLFALICSSVLANATMRTETRLRKKLFDDYDMYARPVTNWTDSVRVYLDYSPLYFNGLNGLQQVFSIYGWLGTKWYIDDLHWNPDDYDGITYLTVKADRIWIPDLGVINSVDQLYGDILDRSHYEGKLYHDGSFRIVRAGTWRTTCILDVTYFPFDEQVCHIEIDSWTIPLPELVLMGNGSELRMQKLRPNGQWEFRDAWLHVEKTEVPGSEYQTLSFVFRVRRKPLYVAMNLVLPCVGILLLELIVFWLPPDAGEKISLGITLLLAQTVFQLVMQGDMPETSDQFPVITIYILLAMLISGMEIVCSVMVLNFHHRPEKRVIPDWVRRYLLGSMANCLGVHMSRESVPSYKMANTRNGYSVNLTRVNGQKVDHSAEAVKGEEDEEEEPGEWINVARVIDRLCFFIFLFLTSGITITLFLLCYYSDEGHNAPLAGYGYSYIPPGEERSLR